MEGIDFFSVERAIKIKDIGRDGVHRDGFGYEKFYDKIADFIQVTQNLRMKTRKEEAEKKNVNGSEKEVRGLKKN